MIWNHAKKHPKPTKMLSLVRISCPTLRLKVRMIDRLAITCTQLPIVPIINQKSKNLIFSDKGSFSHGTFMSKNFLRCWPWSPEDSDNSWLCYYKWDIYREYIELHSGEAGYSPGSYYDLDNRTWLSYRRLLQRIRVVLTGPVRLSKMSVQQGWQSSCLDGTRRGFRYSHHA